jgi:glycosyltransferase involved in cell wall biosynthesis
VLAVSPQDALYGADGNRRIAPPLRFGRGVMGHLLRHRGEYDAVHTCSFPYFSVLACAIALRGTRTQLAVDWFEVWSREYWREYLGPVGGAIGHAVQRLCARVPQQAFVFSDRHGARLAAEGLRRPATKLAGLYSGSSTPARDPGAPREPLVVFAGRHIAEKRLTAIPPAIAAARARVPGLRALILGDGPERDATLRAIDAAGVGDAVESPGFVDPAIVADALGRATCLLLPSRREGYGLVVIEAAAQGTPAIVVDDPDNAAVELVEPGVNGIIAASTSPAELAASIVSVYEDGPALRERTAGWFAAAAPRLTIEASLRAVMATYAGEPVPGDQRASARS